MFSKTSFTGILFTALFILPGFCTQSNFQKVDRYAFSLEKLSVEQQFLDEESLRNINRDAVSGIFDPRFDFYSFVIPTPYGGEELSQIADTLIKVLPVTNIQVREYAEQKYQNLHSFRLSLSGLFSSEPIQYFVELVLYGSVLYQHVSFVRSPTEKFPGIQTLRPRFRIDKSKQPAKPPGGFSMPTFDQVWLLNENYFFHAGLKFKIPLDLPGWSHQTGNQAREYHPEALIAYEAPSKSQILYVLGSNQTHSVTKFFETFREGFVHSEFINLTKESESLHWSFQLKQEPYPLHYQVKGVQGPDSCLLFVLYSLADKGGSFPVPLLTRLRFLDADDSKSLKANLNSSRLQFRQIDENQSLSPFEYRNFPYGLTWDFGQDQIIESGFLEEGSLESEFQIFLHNFTKNFQATLELERDRFLPHQEYHHDFLTNMMGVKPSKTSTRPGFLISAFEKNDQELFYLLITSVNGSKFLRCVVWSTEYLNPDSFSMIPSWNQILPEELDLELYQNHRLKFSIRRRKDWVFRTITHPEIKPIGEIIEIRERLAEHELYVLNSLYMDEELALEIYSHAKPFLKNFRPGETTKEWFEELEVSVRQFHFLLRGKPRLLVQRSFRRGTTLFCTFSFLDPGPVKSEFFTHLGLKI